MKFKLKPEPEIGETRITEWFAIWPVWIDQEIRWLEKVKVRWVYSPTGNIRVNRAPGSIKGQEFDWQGGWKKMEFL